MKNSNCIKILFLIFIIICINNNNILANEKKEENYHLYLPDTKSFEFHTFNAEIKPYIEYRNIIGEHYFCCDMPESDSETIKLKKIHNNPVSKYSTAFNYIECDEEFNNIKNIQIILKNIIVEDKENFYALILYFVSLTENNDEIEFNDIQFILEQLKGIKKINIYYYYLFSNYMKKILIKKETFRKIVLNLFIKNKEILPEGFYDFFMYNYNSKNWFEITNSSGKMTNSKIYFFYKYFYNCGNFQKAAEYYECLSDMADNLIEFNANMYGMLITGYIPVANNNFLDNYKKNETPKLLIKNEKSNVYFNELCKIPHKEISEFLGALNHYNLNNEIICYLTARLEKADVSLPDDYIDNILINENEPEQAFKLFKIIIEKSWFKSDDNILRNAASFFKNKNNYLRFKKLKNLILSKNNKPDNFVEMNLYKAELIFETFSENYQKGYNNFKKILYKNANIEGGKNLIELIFESEAVNFKRLANYIFKKYISGDLIFKNYNYYSSFGEYGIIFKNSAVISKTEKIFKEKYYSVQNQELKLLLTALSFFSKNYKEFNNNITKLIKDKNKIFFLKDFSKHFYPISNLFNSTDEQEIFFDNVQQNISEEKDYYSDNTPNWKRIFIKEYIKQNYNKKKLKDSFKILELYAQNDLTYNDVYFLLKNYLILITSKNDYKELIDFFTDENFEINNLIKESAAAAICEIILKNKNHFGKQKFNFFKTFIDLYLNLPRVYLKNNFVFNVFIKKYNLEKYLVNTAAEK